MAEKLYIASYDVLEFGAHAFLIYDPNTDGDDDFTTDISGVRILRGGAGENYGFLTETSVLVEAYGLVTSSVDWEEAQQSTNRTLISGDWSSMWQFAQTMGTANIPAAGLFDTDILYLLGGPNSNSVINTVLNIVGINFRNVMPTGTEPNDFPGHMGLLDGSGNTTYTAYIYDGLIDTTQFHKRGGADTILLEWNNATDEHARLHISNENASTGLTTVYLDGLNFADVDFYTLNEDLALSKEGDILVQVEDFYLPRGDDAAEGAQTTAFEFMDFYYRRGDDNSNALNASGISKRVLLEGFGGNDTITGGLKNDILRGGEGNDALNGGGYVVGSFDTADYSNDPAAVSVSLNHLGNGSATDGWGDTDTLTSIHNVTLSSHNDSLTIDASGTNVGYPQGHILDGGGGNGDTLTYLDEMDVHDMNTDSVLKWDGSIADRYTGFEILDIAAERLLPDYGTSLSLTGLEFDRIDYSGAGSVGNGATMSFTAAQDHTSLGGGQYLVEYDVSASINLGGGIVHGLTREGSFIAPPWNTVPSAFSVAGTNFGDTVSLNTGGSYVNTGISMLFDSGYGNDTITIDPDITTISGSYIEVLYRKGNDTIYNASKLDKLILWSDIRLSDVTATGNSSSITLNFAGGHGSITLQNFSTDTDVILTGGTITLLANGTITKSGSNPSIVTVEGTWGSDVWQGISSRTETFYGHGGNDVLYAQNGDTLYGGAGDDVLESLAGSSTLYGDLGDDFLEGGAGNDSIFGGEGFDTADYRSATSGIEMNLAFAAVYADGFGGTDTIYSVEHILASDYDDIVTALDNDNTLEGGAGNDIMTGRGGDDYFTDLSGNDTYIYDLGHGSDEISDLGGIDDVIRFGAGITQSSLSIIRSGDDMLISFGNALGSIRVADHYVSSTATIEKIIFDDASELSLVGPYLMVGTSSADILIGTTSSDLIFAYMGNDLLEGGDGDDTLHGGDGNDTIQGGSGNDTISFANAVSGVTGDLVAGTATGEGSDTFTGIENIIGSGYADALTGDTGANVITGGDGNDTIQGGAGNDTLTGGAGTDTASYFSAGSAVTVNLATTSGQNTNGAGTDTISGFENLVGSAFNDTLTGTSGANVIEGLAGNDTLNGSGGTDLLTYASAGAGVTVNLATTTAQNTVGAGTDTISSFENLTGSAFNDTLTGTSGANVIEGLAGNDTLNGAGGTDLLTYASAGAGVTVNLATTTAQNTVGAGTDTISSFENLTGSAFNDTLTGSSGNNVIEGGAGNDTINGQGGTDTLTYANASAAITLNLATSTAQNTGGAGTDTVSNFENLTGSAFNDTLTGNTAANTINGGNGNDTIQGGAGNDTLTGGSGVDTVSYSGDASAVTVNLATTTAQNTGGAGTDTISGIENLTGSAFNDTLTGNSSANTIKGGDGNDTINGGGGNDFLYGGAGQDTLTGSTGGDVFLFENASAFSNVDTIADFSAGSGDKIDVHDVIDLEFDPLTEAISDFVNFTNSGGNSIMSVDRDGTGTTYAFTDVATLTGLTNQDEVALYNSGNLLAA